MSDLRDLTREADTLGTLSTPVETHNGYRQTLTVPVGRYIKHVVTVAGRTQDDVLEALIQRANEIRRFR